MCRKEFWKIRGHSPDLGTVNEAPLSAVGGEVCGGTRKPLVECGLLHGSFKCLKMFMPFDLGHLWKGENPKCSGTCLQRYNL